MPGQIEKHQLRESIKKAVPRHHDVLFGGERQTCCFEKLFQAMSMHFGEVELVARREYERGYKDGKAGRKPKKYKD